MKKFLALLLMLTVCFASVVVAHAEPTKVTLWHYFDSYNDKDMITKWVDDYNALQDKIYIDAQYVSRQELMNQYAIGAISGELPDIGMVDSPDMASFISLGVFEDITDQLNAWGELDKFFPGPLSSCQDSEGKLYGLPQNTNCLCLGVNLDLLKAAGYDHMPKDLAEFKEMVAKTSDPDNGVYGMAMCCIGTEEGTFQLLPWLRSYKDGVSVNVDNLTAPSAVEGLTVLGDFIHSNYMSKEAVNWTQADAWYAFCAGKAAMVECGTWHLAMTGDINGAFNYDFCLLPTGEEGTSTSTIGGENFGICTGCKDTEACVEFLKWMCSKEKEAEWAVGAGKIPVRSDSKAEYTYETKGFQTFVDEMNFAQARGPHPEWPTISEAIYTACQSVFVDNVAPADALAKANDVIAPIVAETPLP